MYPKIDFHIHLVTCDFAFSQISVSRFPVKGHRLVINFFKKIKTRETSIWPFFIFL